MATTTTTAAATAAAAAITAATASAAAAALPMRGSALRHLTRCPSRLRPLASPLQAQQRRWAQVHDVRFLVTTRPRQSVLEKYRDKLDRKAREEGLADVEELKKAYADQIAEQRRGDAERLGSTAAAAAIAAMEETPQKAATTSAPGSPPPPPPPPPSSPPSDASASVSASASPTLTGSSSISKSGVKPLSAILDLSKARELPIKELTAIWRLRHASSPEALCAVIPARTYEAMERAARSRPQFVLPVPHPDQGAEIHFLQWTFDRETGTSTVLFTQLAEYKARGEFAQPHTTVTHHLDLAAEKGVVLMEGRVVDGRGVRADDACWLVMCLQRFYGGWDGEEEMGGESARRRAEERRNLLDWFATGDQRFSVEKLLEETERLG